MSNRKEGASLNFLWFTIPCLSPSLSLACVETTVHLILIEIKLALAEKEGRIFHEIPFQVSKSSRSFEGKIFFTRKPQKMKNRGFRADLFLIKLCHRQLEVPEKGNL